MSAASAQIYELPVAARMRERLAALEAVPAPRPDLEQDLARVSQELQNANAIISGMEDMANHEKDRAERAERLLEQGRVASLRALTDIAERERQIAAATLEIADISRQLADAKAENDRQRQAHAAGTAILRATIERQQSELDGARLLLASREREISGLRAQMERERGFAMSVGEACAVYAESRAEGFAIAAEIRAALAGIVEKGLV